MEMDIKMIDDICRANFELFVELRVKLSSEDIKILEKIERYADELLKLKSLNG